MNPCDPATWWRGSGRPACLGQATNRASRRRPPPWRSSALVSLRSSCRRPTRSSATTPTPPASSAGTRLRRGSSARRPRRSRADFRLLMHGELPEGPEHLYHTASFAGEADSPRDVPAPHRRSSSDVSLTAAPVRTTSGSSFAAFRHLPAISSAREARRRRARASEARLPRIPWSRCPSASSW